MRVSFADIFHLRIPAIRRRLLSQLEIGLPLRQISFLLATYRGGSLLQRDKKSLALIRLSYQNKAFHTFRFSFLLLVFFSRNPYDFLTDRMQEHSFLLFAIFMRSILFYHRFSGTPGSTTVNRILSFSLSAVIVP